MFLYNLFIIRPQNSDHSYIRHRKERTCETTGTDLRLNTLVYWFGQGRMQWCDFLPFFSASPLKEVQLQIFSLIARTNDLDYHRSLDLVEAVKRDLCDLHLQMSLRWSLSCLVSYSDTSVNLPIQEKQYDCYLCLEY